MNTYKRFGLILFAGLLLGALNAVDGLSLASLIYMGSLKQHFLFGVSAGLIGSAILLIMAAIWSSSPYTIASSQDILALIAALLAMSIAKTINDSNLNIDPLPTLLCAIAIMALLLGVSMYLLGVLRLGKMVRYIPYPVIGGFLAGTGWLIFISTLGALVDSLSMSDTVHRMLTGQDYQAWLLPLGFGVALLIAQSVFPGTYTFPITLLAGFILFYLYLNMQGISVLQAQQAHWMIGPFPSGHIPLIPNLEIKGVQWSLIYDHIGEYCAATILGVISTLLNISGFEFTSKKNMDIDRELKLTGAANLAVGSIGGIAGYHVLSLSKTNMDFKIESRLVGIIAGLVCLLIVFAGTRPLTYLPSFIFTGILLYIGMDFMVEWVIKIKRKISWLDYLIVASILIVIISFGLLTGIFVGLLLSLAIFFFRYSRIPVIASFLDGKVMHSQVERNPADQIILQQYGDHILIVNVRGYLFFGNTYEMAARVARSIQTRSKAYHRGFLIFNFRQVTGIEVSGTISFINLMYEAKAQEMMVVFASLPEEIAREMARLKALEHQTIEYQRFADIDHALGWCEDELLQQARAQVKPSFQKLFAMTFAEIDTPEELLKFAQKRHFKAGDLLCREGEPTKEMFWIIEGELQAITAFGKPEQKRLRQLMPGSMVGEMALFLNETRSATVLAVKDCIAYCFSEASISEMNKIRPDLSWAFTKSILTIVARRLQNTNRLLATQERIYQQ